MIEGENAKIKADDIVPNWTEDQKTILCRVMKLSEK